MNVSIIGYGSRGTLYGGLFADNNGIEIAAVCDIRKEQLNLAQEALGLKDDKLFDSEQAFFAAGKQSDLLVVSTPDMLHARHALKALELGYDLLLEKPIAATLEDCEMIYRAAIKFNRKVFVCHVLRYAKFFATIAQELKSGVYGKLATINLTENVAYWHQAHSYVRGNWRNEATSSPMIIAKCCHDLDLLCWFAGSECKGVSSMGSLSFYTAANAPKGSADRCLNCAVKNECAYDAERYYLNVLDTKGFTWPVNVLTPRDDRDKIMEALATGPYGRCVFKCDNDVVDHQVVNLEFEGGVTAHLTMTAFSETSSRHIHVHCEQGEIFGNMEDNRLTCNIFGKSSRMIDLSVKDNGFGHGGGDFNLVKDIVAAYRGEPTSALTEIKHSIQSHFIGFAAEKSRHNGGKLERPIQ